MKNKDDELYKKNVMPVEASNYVLVMPTSFLCKVRCFQGTLKKKHHGFLCV
jgi:hypothetical protein